MDPWTDFWLGLIAAVAESAALAAIIVSVSAIIVSVVRAKPSASPFIWDLIFTFILFPFYILDVFRDFRVSSLAAGAAKSRAQRPPLTEREFAAEFGEVSPEIVESVLRVLARVAADDGADEPPVPDFDPRRLRAGDTLYCDLGFGCNDLAGFSLFDELHKEFGRRWRWEDLFDERRRFALTTVDDVVRRVAALLADEKPASGSPGDAAT
ncbi:MAG TPA: hypothetical protein VGE52_05870 [Pirellulales bacterium]